MKFKLTTLLTLVFVVAVTLFFAEPFLRKRPKSFSKWEFDFQNQGYAALGHSFYGRLERGFEDKNKSFGSATAWLPTPAGFASKDGKALMDHLTNWLVAELEKDSAVVEVSEVAVGKR